MDREIALAGEVQRPLTAMAVVAQVRLIQEVMKAVMKVDEHFGVIPGTKKPTLYKPGAEKLLVTFRIAAESPNVEDLSTPDSVRYRVTRKGQSIISGVFVGAGVGECSSDEEKYKWRRPVCDEEYDETPVDRRREVWKRVSGSNTKIKQVRTNPADVANTVLKMADKRAYVALALQTTAASDCFSQDLEDLPEEVRESVVEGETAKPAIKEPEAAPAPKAEKAADGAVKVTFVPTAYGSKPTKKEGQTRYYCKHGSEWLATFDDTLGGLLKMAAEKKSTITATYKIDGEFKTIVDIEGMA